MMLLLCQPLTEYKQVYPYYVPWNYQKLQTEPYFDLYATAYELMPIFLHA